MEVRGTDSWIISNLPRGFDKGEVLGVLSECGWPVLAGRPLRSRTEMRVLADVAPKKMTIASGGKIPYVLRREFADAASPSRDQQTTAAKQRQNEEGSNQEKTELQVMIDEQMQGFLNSGHDHKKAATASSASSSSSQASVQITERTAAQPSAQQVMPDYKKDKMEFRQEICQMMKKMEERQDRAEQR
jgi:hypothetical protein